MGEGAESAHDAHQAAQDLSHKREAALNRQIAEAIAFSMRKVHSAWQVALK